VVSQLAVHSYLPERGVTSASGEWTLRYGPDRCARLADRAGRTRWAPGSIDKPVPGHLRLEAGGELAVHSGEHQPKPGVVHEPAWRTGPIAMDAAWLCVTDDGDLLLTDRGHVPLWSLRTGMIETTSLGDSAPVSALRTNTYLRRSSGTSTRTVVRVADGALLHTENLGYTRISRTVPADIAESLDRPGAELTWRFLGPTGRGQWKLVLVGAGGELLWTGGDEPADEVRAPATAPSEALPRDDGLSSPDLEFCGLTVVRDIDPDEVLRRFGATDDQIGTATWLELTDRVGFEEIDWSAGDNAIAAFAVGPHVLAVEWLASDGVSKPEISAGTSAVSYFEDATGFSAILVSRDGTTLAEMIDWVLDEIGGAEPEVLGGQLVAMGITDDADPALFDMLELFHRLTDVSITTAELAASTRVAVFRGRRRLGGDR
jgi:hypothetical protein